MSNHIVHWTPDKKERAINLLTAYFSLYGPGECICQNDDALIHAPDLLSTIADDVLVEGDGLVWNNPDEN